MEAIQSPDEEISVHSTRDGSTDFSSLRDTLFDGEISNSETIFDEAKENIWTEDGWDEGMIKVEELGCTAKGTDFEEEELSDGTAGIRYKP